MVWVVVEEKRKRLPPNTIHKRIRQLLLLGRVNPKAHLTLTPRSVIIFHLLLSFFVSVSVNDIIISASTSCSRICTLLGRRDDDAVVLSAPQLIYLVWLAEKQKRFREEAPLLTDRNEISL